MSDPPDTLRVCEACGGDATPDCGWCTEGYQRHAQTTVWRKFRRGMKKISGTYGFLDAVVRDVLERLTDCRRPGAADLLVEGKRALLEWDLTDPVDGDRDSITAELVDFQRRALDFLTE